MSVSDPMDCSLPGSSIHGIFQARVLEWGTTAFSEEWCYILFLLQVCAVSITTYSTESIAKFGCSVAKSHLTFFVTPWTVTRLLLSVGLPRQEYWSGLPFPSPGDLPDPGITPTSPAWASGIFTTGTSGKPP